MDIIIKKYQQRFRKVKEEMENWNELQSRLISQFTNASSIIQRLQILQDSKNYSALRCVEGIQEAVLLKQMNSLQTILLSMNETMEKFHSVVLSLDKMVRAGRQLIKGGSVQKNVKQLQQHVGMKPSIADCLDGLQLLYEMHQSEYRLKLSVISAISAFALKPSATDDLGALQQLLVDQPNIPKEEGMCFKFRKTSVLTEEQEISCTWVLHYSNSSSVCVGFSRTSVFLEDPTWVWRHFWRIRATYSSGEADNYLDHCRWKVLDLGNGRERL